MLPSPTPDEPLWPGGPSPAEAAANIRRAFHLDDIIVSEGAPSGLTDGELRWVISEWYATSLPLPLFRAAMSKLQKSGFVYTASLFGGERTKIGVSSDPASRAAAAGGRLRRAWYVGLAAVPLEQTLLAATAPWSDPWHSETVALAPEEVASLVERLLEGLDLPARPPEDSWRWRWRERAAWAAPIWQRLGEWGLPEEYLRATGLP